MEWLIVGIAALGLGYLVLISIRRAEARRREDAQGHQPHKPGPGYDPKEQARSFGAGHGIGGDDSG